MILSADRKRRRKPFRLNSTLHISSSLLLCNKIKYLFFLQIIVVLQQQQQQQQQHFIFVDKQKHNNNYTAWAFSLQGVQKQVVMPSSPSFISTTKELKGQHHQVIDPTNNGCRKHFKSFTKIKSTTQDEELINNNDNNRNNRTNKSNYINANDVTRRMMKRIIRTRYDNSSKKNGKRNSKIDTTTTTKTEPQWIQSEQKEGDQQSKIQNCPNHIAIICDGNSRWSRRNPNNMKEDDHDQNDTQLQFDHDQSNNNNSNNDNNYSSTFWGHSRGAFNVINLIKHIQKEYSSSVNYVTMYAFSTENWSRGDNEIKDLWNVIETFSNKFYHWALKHNIRVKIIGDLNDDRIPMSLRDRLMTLEIDSHRSFESSSTTSRNNSNDGLTLSIAINYGGRKDIINASLKLAELISRGEIILSNNGNNTENDNDDDIESVFANLLSTSSIPDPDLIIRTGGEQRLSNFLIWNCAYSELYFSDVLWPDFNEVELDKAIHWYGCRERRFGGRK